MLKLAKLILAGYLVLIIGCANTPEKNLEDEFATDTAATTDLANANADEFADFSENSSSGPNASKTTSSGQDEFAEFDTPKSSVGATSAQSSEDGEFAQFDQTTSSSPALEQDVVSDQTALNGSKANEHETSQIVTQAPTSVNSTIDPPEVSPSHQSTSEATPSTSKISHIQSVKYQSNQAGGTVVISADQPLTFKTRQNPATQQLIVELENTVLPSKLKRTLNTKDMASTIGSVDMYQKSNSKVARIVIQLRPNSPEPLVQPEGNSLLIIGAENAQVAKTKSSTNSSAENETVEQSAKESQDANINLDDEKILGTFGVRDFIANNSKFYGRKISIETKDLDVRDTLKFIAEEAGINMIIDDNVSGKLSVKLKSVPWDQALVLVLKSKNLGYIRQGNVLRIASVDRIASEQRTAIGLKRQMEGTAPLVVKRFFIGYADVNDLEKKIKNFLSDGDQQAQAAGAQQSQQAQSQNKSTRSSVIGDARTSSLIITDTQDNIDRIAKLIKALDSQPPQVLIEGKVVEASEKFTRSMGVNWSMGGSSFNIGRNSSGQMTSITPTLNYNGGALPGGFNIGMSIGTLDAIGDLSATLSLNEKQDRVRILSAPRITVLTNVDANIDQTTQIMLPMSSTSNATNGSTTQTYQPYSFGVSLKVKPQVSNEGTVAMDMEIKRSLLGAGSIGGTPPIEERKAKSRVIVKNGQTAVIGGVFQTDAINTRVGVPFLKDIPVLGMLFRGDELTKSKNELIIFLTPKILPNVVGQINSQDGTDFN